MGSPVSCRPVTTSRAKGELAAGAALHGTALEKRPGAHGAASMAFAPGKNGENGSFGMTHGKTS